MSGHRWISRGLSAGTLVGALLAGGPSASAKCAPDDDHPACSTIVDSHGTISGPGPGGPIEIEGPVLKRILYLTGATEWPGATQFFADPPRREEMGTPYLIRVVSTRIDRDTGVRVGRTRVLVQTVYPYAPDGAWTFTRGGQSLHDRFGGVIRPQERWWRSVFLADLLRREGLPAEDPAAGAAPPRSAGSAASDEAAEGTTSLLVALAALAVLLVAGALGGRPRGAAVR
jgi:hypothetical protein